MAPRSTYLALRRVCGRGEWNEWERLARQDERLNAALYLARKFGATYRIATLVANGTLDDTTMAWLYSGARTATEWSVRPAIGSCCFIYYGSRGSSLAHLEVPSYGHLRAFELSQKRQASTAAATGGARTPRIRLPGQ